MRIVIVGVGAMGCLLGAYLEKVADVSLVGHWPEQIAAIRRFGLWLERPDGARTRHFLPVLYDASTIDGADVALVAVKSHQTAVATATVAAFLGPAGLALTLQNGLNNRAALRAGLGPERVALGITSEGATVVGPGVVRHAGHGLTYIGREPRLGRAQRDRLPRLATLFNSAGFQTDLVDDTDSLVWGKLAVNAAINPLTALLRVPNGFLLEHSSLLLLMDRAAGEVAAVAAAQGIALPFPDAPERAREVARYTAANHSSMLQDTLRGAPTEVDAICGAVVRAGRAVGVATPVNERLCDLVHQTEDGRLPALSSGDVAGLLAWLEAAPER